MTLDELQKVNPLFNEYPEDWDGHVADSHVRQFKLVVDSVLGDEVPYDVNSQDCTSIATFGIPNDCLTVPDGGNSMGLILSTFKNLYTITNPWYVQPAVLERLERELSQAGFLLAPFELFAEPGADAYKSGALRDSPVWISLFDYL